MDVILAYLSKRTTWSRAGSRARHMGTTSVLVRRVASPVASPQREELVLRVHPYFVEDGAEMVPHRALAQIHLGRDRRDALTPNQPRDHLPLAGRQPGRGRNF